VIAPGPASNGKARGTTPDSPGRVLPPNLHTPWVNNSMATMNRRTPPAIIKLNTVIPKILRIAVPPIANTISTLVPEVIIAVFETAFRSSFFIFCVIAIKRGTVPIGLSTTKRAIVDLSKCSNNSELVSLSVIDLQKH
jgi:hypothetical protein